MSINREWISGEVRRLIKKYQSRDPFEICEHLQIAVRYKDCGQLKAYYVVIARIKNIVLNNRLSEMLQRVLVAHELGHAILHSRLAFSRGFQESGLFDDASSTEYEANMFAADLLLEDREVYEAVSCGEYTFFQVAQELMVPFELLDYKLRMMKQRGLSLEIPIDSKSTFLQNLPDDPGFFED